MKNNEVMIGDWLRFTDPNNTKETEFSQITMEIIGFDSPKYWRCFSPIEITPEILEANGFKLYKTIGSLRFFENTDRKLKFEFYGKTIEDHASNRIIELGYVHELQHALRLIGLDDFADNFKVVKGGAQ